MARPVFLTIDTELMWRHHAAGLPADEVAARSLEPAGVGIAYQLRMLAEHGLKATFFVDPMPAAVYGPDALGRVIAAILAAGQEVQLHLHPNWAGASLADRTAHGAFELTDHDEAGQTALIAAARDALIAAGAPPPVAFRAGSYAACDATLAALATLGFRYDSSHNGAHAPWPSAIRLPPRRIAPSLHAGVVEVPVTVLEDAAGRLRHFQVCALSVAEMRAALDHAVARDHAATTIVSHSFELATRRGTAANRVHVRRFAGLCRLLAERRDRLATTHFRDLPSLALGRLDAPCPPSAWRRRWRQAEQLWSNTVCERAA